MYFSIKMPMNAGLYFPLSKINAKCRSLIGFSSFALNSMRKLPCQKLQFFLKYIRPTTKNIRILDSIPPQKFSSLAPECKLQSTEFVKQLIVLSLYQIKKKRLAVPKGQLRHKCQRCTLTWTAK
jgi:hypothetical protein